MGSLSAPLSLPSRTDIGSRGSTAHTTPIVFRHVVAQIAKCRGNYQHGNQDGIGDGKYQHKEETDDAVPFGLLQFVAFLFCDGLWKGKKRFL